jgi:mannose-6-phosphate isomerase-like protein (cupin superfamily)
MVIKPNPDKIASPPGGWIWDYELPSDDVGISYQEYSGPAPEKGYWVNTVCWEAYMVIDGTASIVIDGQVYATEKKDLVVVKPGQKVRFNEAKNLKIVTITKPNWYPDQAKIIEE